MKEKCKATDVCEDRSVVSKKIRTNQVGKVEEEAHIPSSPCQQVTTETEKLNKSKLAKVEENWVSRYKTLVPQLFTDISFRCLRVAATVHAPFFLPTCLPLTACQTDRFGLDTEKNSLRETDRRAAALSTEIIMKKLETN